MWRVEAWRLAGAAPELRLEEEAACGCWHSGGHLAFPQTSLFPVPVAAAIVSCTLSYSCEHNASVSAIPHPFPWVSCP